MISYFQAIIIGLLQGISELFPISSLGHSVILPRLVGWNIHQNDSFFLSFLVATHLATAIVLFVFFWKDWREILRGMWRSFVARRIDDADYASKLGWHLVVGTIPAGAVGLLLEDKLRTLFVSASSAAFFLILNGFLLYGAEKLRKKAIQINNDSNADRRLSKLTWGKALVVGLSQLIALIPGFSRSGSTMAGSLLVGLNNEDAAKYSFLLATPIIGAAAILKVPELFTIENQPLLGPAFVGALCAGFAAYIAVRFLMKFFHTNKLTPFAMYCVVAGLLFSAILYWK